MKSPNEVIFIIKFLIMLIVSTYQVVDIFLTDYKKTPSLLRFPEERAANGQPLQGTYFLVKLLGPPEQC